MATAFIQLEDSPMFQNQLSYLERAADELKDRCQTLYKGSKMFMTALGESYNGENSFADSLEAFGCGQDDPISVSVGGPIVSKFINAFRELANYKEMLLLQVEHLLVDRLNHFMTVDIQNVKESRQQFNRSRYSCDQVRSLTFDVKVWEPSIVKLFNTLGNAYCNSIWEGSLLKNESVDESNAISTTISKPCAKGDFSNKEKYIHAKYGDKSLIIRDVLQAGDPSFATNIWQAVKADNLREAYRLIAISETNIVNTTFDDVVSIELYHHVVDARDSSLESHKEEKEQHDPSSCLRIKDSNDPGNCLQGCSLLHLACQGGNRVMLELLLQFGADINMCDFHGRTPLHHCISLGNNSLAKYLLRKGARSSIKDHGGLTAVERAMDKGAIKDEELFILLNES